MSEEIKNETIEETTVEETPEQVEPVEVEESDPVETDETVDEVEQEEASEQAPESENRAHRDAAKYRRQLRDLEATHEQTLNRVEALEAQLEQVRWDALVQHSKDQAQAYDTPTGRVIATIKPELLKAEGFGMEKFLDKDGRISYLRFTQAQRVVALKHGLLVDVQGNEPRANYSGPLFPAGTRHASDSSKAEGSVSQAVVDSLSNSNIRSSVWYT